MALAVWATVKISPPMDWRILSYHFYCIWIFRAQCFTLTTQYSNTSYCAILQFVSLRPLKVKVCLACETGVELDYISRILLYSIMLPHFWSSYKYLIRYSLHYCPRWRHMAPWYLANIVSEKRCVIWSHLENAIRKIYATLRWRHNGRDGVTSLAIVYSTVYWGADQRKHQSFPSLAFLRGSPVTGEFPAQMASHAENIFIWWRHHDLFLALNSCRSHDVCRRH